jgi:hypothetical protein
MVSVLIPVQFSSSSGKYITNLVQISKAGTSFSGAGTSFLGAPEQNNLPPVQFLGSQYPAEFVNRQNS